MSSKPVEAMNSPLGQALFRIFVAGITTVGTIGIGILLNDGAKTRDLLYTYQFSNNERIARLEGTVSEIKGSVDAHRRRLDSNDADVRSVWTRLYELGRSVK